MTSSGARKRIADREVETLADLALAADGSAVTARVAAAGGLGIEALGLELLGPAARRLGRRWEDDDCGFLDVTLGVGRLQQALFRLGSALPAPPPAATGTYRALLTPVPGEQHTFGVQIVAELFRQQGWLVTGGGGRSRAALCAALGREWFHLLGLSVACERLLDSLAADIDALRSASRNPDLVVLIGGPLVDRRPELLAGIGADGIAAGAREAPGQARRLIAQRSGSPSHRAEPR